MKGIVAAGAVLAVLGILGLAVPIFSTSQTRNVAQLGSLKIQANEETSHVVPPTLAGGALVIGLILIGVGYTRH
jgi:hypothetical protein